METFRRFTKPVSYVVTAGMLALSLHLPVASATMVGTEAVVYAAQIQQQRSRIHEALSRQEVTGKLVSLGVDPAQVQARVDALTDDEAQRLAESLDKMPAGGDVVGALVLIFIVLLVTDLLGLTHMFPFTNKGSARP
ncbi:MAG: hypothetical protein FD165_2368 [Gammaproteobacteria bacterium]|nr:MAG: hypothetical protein FD165_2368 [Gammaproteobacteria bacterium]TND01957.1 MAG: hypothetical protein FD120_2485 [Gammaproteobacteria bacterium]